MLQFSLLIIYTRLLELTKSLVPQTQALFNISLTAQLSSRTTYASSGPSCLLGTSFLSGNLVQSGSHGIVVAVLFPVKKSVIFVRRLFAVEDGFAIVRKSLANLD